MSSVTVYKDGVEHKCSFFKVFGHSIMNPFLTAIAIWSILYSGRLVANYEALIGMVPYLTPFLVYAWASLYLIGGILMLLGSALVRSKLSAAGCGLFATSAIMSAVFVFSSHIEGYWWQAFNMCLFATAALIRVRHLIKGEMLIWMRK